MAIRTVLKIGGSLLSQTDWPSRLDRWLQKQPAGLYFTIVGGGEAIEAMRELDRIHMLDQNAMHWRCIDMLEATFDVAVELLERVIPNLKTVRTSTSLGSIVSNADGPKQERAELVLVTVPSFYNIDSCDNAPSILLKRETVLPEIGWQTTSDTLAMFLASVTESNRCVLFKSCNVESFATLEDAVAAGVADSQVLQYASSGIRCELITL
jgi:5-(aminomethyl)-3-furanmethanol phosphate kinase